MDKKIQESSRQKVKFWDKDIDTILYTIMCIVTIPALILGLWYMKAAKEFLPQGTSACVLWQVFGIYCPGCGGTRSFRAMFRGDILQALYYHPVAVYGAVLYLVYFVSQTVMRVSKGRIPGLKFRPVYLFIMLGLIALNFIVRNVLLLFFDIPTL